MRNIKFRGFNKSLKKWIFGAPYFSEGDWWILVDENTKSDDIGTGSYLVDENSIGQYTGLEDKNDKEIYKGDVLELTDWYDNSISIHTVAFNNSAFVCLRPDDTEHPFFYLQGNDFLKDGYKIIGNIYQNPELTTI